MEIAAVSTSIGSIIVFSRDKVIEFAPRDISLWDGWLDGH